jgi:hypothetical protein
LIAKKQGFGKVAVTLFQSSSASGVVHGVRGIRRECLTTVRKKTASSSSRCCSHSVLAFILLDPLLILATMLARHVDSFSASHVLQSLAQQRNKEVETGGTDAATATSSISNNVVL